MLIADGQHVLGVTSNTLREALPPLDRTSLIVGSGMSKARHTLEVVFLATSSPVNAFLYQGRRKRTLKSPAHQPNHGGRKKQMLCLLRPASVRL